MVSKVARKVAGKVGKRQRLDEKGFTMVELVIVVAIMGIIGAVLVPSFGNMTSKAKLTSDISTVKTLQRTAEVYKAEKGTWPTGTTLSTLNATLESGNYIKEGATLQIAGADIKVDATNNKIQLKVPDTSIDTDLQQAFDKLDAGTQAWVDGMTPTQPNLPAQSNPPVQPES